VYIRQFAPRGCNREIIINIRIANDNAIRFFSVADVRHTEDGRVNRRLVIRYRHNDARSRRNTYFKNANLR